MLQLLASGYLYKEVADVLHLSVPTVNTYVRRIYEKLNVRSRAQGQPLRMGSGLPGRKRLRGNKNAGRRAQ